MKAPACPSAWEALANCQRSKAHCRVPATWEETSNPDSTSLTKRSSSTVAQGESGILMRKPLYFMQD